MEQYQLIRSNRRTLGFEITKDGTLVVRAPLHMPKREIEQYIIEKSAWIEKHKKAAKQRSQLAEKQNVRKMTREELEALADQALQIIPQRVAYYAEKMNVTYGRITIRNQKTRWGSCTSQGNLNFNCLLMKAPKEVLDYVVVHELCHRKEMNHSKAFWDYVESVMPDYKVHRAWLKEPGALLMEENI